MHVSTQPDVESLLRSPELAAVENLGVLRLRSTGRALSNKDIAKRLAHPVWTKPCRKTAFDAVGPGESACVVVSDHTRATAVNRLLPILVRGWIARGCSIEDISILFASGIHRRPTQSEVNAILGADTAKRFQGRIRFHDPDNRKELVAVGTTRRGNAVLINRLAVECDRLILTGSVTYHYHAGFTGGRKSLVPGLAARSTIAFNHSLALSPAEDRIHPMVAPGVLNGNPVADDMIEAARMRTPDLIINTALSPDGNIADLVCGSLEPAHRKACESAERIYLVNLPRRADFVIAFAGATAKNWIQAHKALYNAHRAVREDGRVILVAPCPEGLGDERFRYWMRKKSLKAMARELRASPEVLGQTALSTRGKARNSVLVTRMPEADARDLGIRTAPDVTTAVRRIIRAFARAGKRRPTFYLMPHAQYTVPFVTER